MHQQSHVSTGEWTACLGKERGHVVPAQCLYARGAPILGWEASGVPEAMCWWRNFPQVCTSLLHESSHGICLHFVYGESAGRRVNDLALDVYICELHGFGNPFEGGCCVPPHMHKQVDTIHVDAGLVQFNLPQSLGVEHGESGPRVPLGNCRT